MATAEAGWFVLDAQSQPVGPYDAAAMIAMAAAGHISSEALVWREGRSSWDKLADVPELQAGSAAASAGAAAAPGVSRSAQATPAVDPSDPLAAFQAEISAIEAAEEAAAAEAADAEAPGTPDELEFEDDDGTMYVWDTSLRKYVPAGRQNGETSTSEPTAQQVQQQQQQQQQEQQEQRQQNEYDMEAMTFVDTAEVVPTLAAAKAALAAAELEAEMDPEQLAKEERKRKAEAAIADHKEKMAKRKEADAESAAKQAAWFELKKNTSVYVTGLPLDVTEEEVEREFSKCGIIKEGPDGKPRIKLYRDKATGNLKGDGLVTFLKEPSVELALQLMDGAHFRATGGPMTVTNAKFEMKGEKYVPKPKGGPKGGKGSKKQQIEKLEKKLGWGGFDDKQPPEKVTVVLMHMFGPEEFVGQPDLVQELEADILAECSKQGPIDKVKVYSTHPEGAVTVRFKTIEDAEKCIGVMQGRWFGGRQVQAHMWDGRTNYNVKVQETPEQEAARLEAFARELEAQQQQ